MNAERFRNPGGTRGGLGMFLLGLVMAIAGGYLFVDNVRVFSSPWSVFGFSGYSLALVPLIFGIFFLFFSGRSIIGWLLTLAGVVIIFAGIISISVSFLGPLPSSNTLVIFVLLFGGLGLLARSLRDLSGSGKPRRRADALEIAPPPWR
ncbi:MAG: hypothetical protein U0531_08170 [Dehalococcoidia bacterium]